MCEGGYLDAVNALIEAVNRGFERAVLRFQNMEDEMQNRVAGLEGASPIAFESGGGGKRRLVIRGRLSAGGGVASVAQE